MPVNKLILLILDGWGLGKVPSADAILQADTPCFDSLWKSYPHSTLVTFGEDVGLPEGQMGNSEVGHMNLGAGRVVYQELARINVAIRTKELENNKVLQETIQYSLDNKKTFHLMGLVSDGGVHSHINHLIALVDIISKAGVKDIMIHAFLDGRDTDPHSGLGFIKTLEESIKGKAQIATLTGRYYAMDRDHRWERIKLAYDAMVNGIGKNTTDPLESIQQSYDEGVTDEFIMPIINTQNGIPIAKIKEGDVVLSFNFRTDRPRQITQALTQEDIVDYSMHKMSLYYVTMTSYHEDYKNIKVIFTSEDITNTLGETIAKHGYQQARIAETEKYPHVTFFFNGGREQAFKNEKRILIPSPKVATYDLQPEMSAVGVKDAILSEIKDHQPAFICLNFANTDMVGHTGVFKAAMKAAETVDKCLSEIIPAALNKDYSIIILADHGNSDYMINEDGTPNTAHTKNPVPCIIIDPKDQIKSVKDGKLADIAPTILKIMGIETPKEMTGNVLI